MGEALAVNASRLIFLAKTNRPAATGVYLADAVLDRALAEVGE